MRIDERGGLVRPDVSETDAARIAFECFGIEVVASELGSNQDRNFLLTEADGSKSVLRIDNPAFSDEAREAQHAALDAYRAAGVAVATVLPGLDGESTQRWEALLRGEANSLRGSPCLTAATSPPWLSLSSDPLPQPQ